MKTTNLGFAALAGSLLLAGSVAAGHRCGGYYQGGSAGVYHAPTGYGGYGSNRSSYYHSAPYQSEYRQPGLAGRRFGRSQPQYHYGDNYVTPYDERGTVMHARPMDERNYARDDERVLRERTSLYSDPDRGFVLENRAAVGVTLTEHDEGVLVTSVVSDGPAWRAGLSEGDIISSVNRVQIRTADEVIGHLSDLDVGDTADFRIMRDNLNREFAVEMAATAEVFPSQTRTEFETESRQQRTESESDIRRAPEESIEQRDDRPGQLPEERSDSIDDRRDDPARRPELPEAPTPAEAADDVPDVPRNTLDDRAKNDALNEAQEKTPEEVEEIEKRVQEQSDKVREQIEGAKESKPESGTEPAPEEPNPKDE